MTLPTSAYRGHAGVTWDTVTVQKVLDYLNTSLTPANDARYAPFARDGRGVVGWTRGFPTYTTSTETRIMNTYADVLAGRIYECALMNVTPDVGNTKNTEFRIRYTTNSVLPGNSSTLMALSLRLSTFELGAIRAYYLPSSNLRLWLGAFIASIDGTTSVRAWCPGDGGILSIADMGVAPVQTGGVP
jgi:hypothetical protein